MERLSPGIRFQEFDNTGVSTVPVVAGAAFIGQTSKGHAFVPTLIRNSAEFAKVFGSSTQNIYMPLAVKSYLEVGTPAYVTRILGTDGYAADKALVFRTGSTVVGVLHATDKTSATTNWFHRSAMTQNGSGLFTLSVSGSAQHPRDLFSSMSLNPSLTTYLGRSLGASPNVGGTTSTGKSSFFYLNFKEQQSASIASVGSSIQWRAITGSIDFAQSYKVASTPWITSQKVSTISRNLFKFHTLGHGNAASYEVKVGIRDIRPAGTIAGSEYGSFTVVVRAVDQSKITNSPHQFTQDDTDNRPVILETFPNCNIDPDSPNYISRMIGDKYYTIDSDNQLIPTGLYQNNSAYIRVEVATEVENRAIDVNLVPFGFRSLTNPVPSTWGNTPAVKMIPAQTLNSIYNSRVYWGFNFTSTDNLNYLSPLPATSTTTGSNTDFYLSSYTQSIGAATPSATSPYTGSIDLTTNTNLETRKFVVPFQGGFDGWRPNRQMATGTSIITGNSQGLDFSSTSGTYLDQLPNGYELMKIAVDILSDHDNYDFNTLVIPGVLYDKHSNLTTYAKNMVEERGDAFYIMDVGVPETSATSIVNAVQGLDTNYAAVYWPWMRVMDTDRNKPILVPPSCVIPRVFAYTDKFVKPWAAPAGTDAGRLNDVIEPAIRLTQAARNTLFQGRINPVLSYTNRPGAYVWGQLTLQGKPSALDRIATRRMLIHIKKWIKDRTLDFVFAANTAATRTTLKNLVQPYFAKLVEEGGAYSATFICDETNNTPTELDRNVLKGTIAIKPTKFAEFIEFDINLTPNV